MLILKIIERYLKLPVFMDTKIIKLTFVLSMDFTKSLLRDSTRHRQENDSQSTPKDGNKRLDRTPPEEPKTMGKNTSTSIIPRA